MNALARDGLPRGTVPSAFDTEARFYDRLVRANPGYHRHLLLSAQRLDLPYDGKHLRLLDAGCGTGASTAALVATAPGARITAFDASREMLARARDKTWPEGVEFVHTPAEELAGVEGPFDAILAAYLVRNLADPTSGLRRLRGLLRPGGRIAVHEYSVRDSRRARWVWNAVCAAVIIPLGKIVTGDATLYRHLRRSVAEFDGIGALAQRLTDAGFTDVHTATVPGWQRDIVHTVVGTAPQETP
ncbi:class I SAM-dependent methyltransferase [Amycolatopsis roodepoortensis]|uniref:Ubiquinone/menaquinone biosynthesis C-methylase UbiE n=1 Tax=Amycolatopsis roodepoortensis TaxID=700274 RepID=A0ABR9LCB3_9PSEU|nr:class I SAM-dependent methyltransferase [Amycolatopsis roodepoortensis]MBE1577813.1 ubiquinone/menaquinone biosynthesis C-methylase UbiE [Amycolatopsis roodepoortensis]